MINVFRIDLTSTLYVRQTNMYSMVCHWQLSTGSLYSGSYIIYKIRAINYSR